MKKSVINKKRAKLYPKKIAASVFAANIISAIVPYSVLASDITGIIPKNGVYDITADKISGETGFRQYENFKLTQGDIANLQFIKDSAEYSKFINLVDNQVNINGILNTMKGNNFYNGHAIFVSPSGMVIGSSGVLNVGSFSAITPSQSTYNIFKDSYIENNLSGYEFGTDNYKGLITDSTGNIVVNGKIFARDEVNLYGKNINVQNAGIIAGIQRNDNVINFNVQAETLFNNLVKSNITNAESFNLVGGKIVLEAGESGSDINNTAVTIDNSKLAANDIDIHSNANTSLTFDPSHFDFDNAAWGMADKAETKIDIKNSQISAEDVKINANAKNETTQNINLITPTIVNWIADDDAKISEYFSSNPYTGFDGARASAVVNIINSNVKAQNDISIETNAEANLSVNSDLLGQTVPVFLYGLGTETESKVNVKDSKLNAANDINLSAVSQSEEEVEINNKSFFSLSATDALAFAMLNNNIVSDTKVIVDNSSVNANNFEAKAINLSTSEVEVEESANINKNDFSTPGKDGEPGKQGSAASMGIVMNHVKTDSQVKIKNGSKIETEEDVRLLSQNLNSIKNKVENEIEGGDDAEGDNDNKSAFQKFQDKIGKVNEYTNKTLLSFFNDKDKLNGEMDEAAFQFSGSAIYNRSNNTAKTSVNNSQINAGNVTVQTNMVDLTANSAKAEATEETKFGAGMAVVINEQNNTTVSDINGSTINSGALTVDATTQLPMNPMELTYGKEDTPITDVELKFGVALDEDENGELDWSAVLPDPSDWSLGINFGASIGDWFDKPEFELEGLFNNFAQASGTANGLGVAGSIVYNSIVNNTTASITGNSNVNVTEGDAVLNSVNLITGYNAAGMVDFLVQLANDLGEYQPSQGGGKVGVGGTVLIDNYTNNAAAKIEDSAVIVEKGDVKLNSVSKQNYISAAITGGTAETFALEGTVHIQNLDGETNSSIKNSEVSGKNVSVTAGKGKISAKKSGDLELNENTNELSAGDAREINDKILNIIVAGAFAKQSQEAEEGETSSSGGAVGATVNISNFDNQLNAVVENSIVTAEENVTAEASHDQLSVDVLGSAAFAGGVKVKKADNNNGSSDNEGGSDSSESSSEEQTTKNIGNWMDILDAATDDDEDILGLNKLFEQNDASEKANDKVKENKDTINNADKNVDENGKEKTPDKDNSKENEKSNSETITNNENDKMEGDNNTKADTDTAKSNMSIAAAGAVNVTNKATKVTSKINNSTVNVGKRLEVKANQENLSVNVNGGVAKAGNVGAGAGIGIYNDKSETNAIIGDDNNKTKINFTKAIDEKLLNVNADNKNMMVNVTAGIGVASNQENGTAAAVGGSFNYNALKEQTNAEIKNTEIQNAENIDKDIDVNVNANDNSEVWNAAGGISATQGGSSAYGAGIGANVNYSNKTVNAQISDSIIKNAKDAKINANLEQKYNSISAAGALASGAESSYTFDGAINTELNASKITAKAKNTNITSSGDIEIKANETIDNRSLAGALDMSASSSGVGVGIGAIVNVNNSNVTAEADALTVEKSNSITINANETENLRFLAANMGLQFGGATTVNVNGISNVLVSDVVAQSIGNSVLNSTGNVGINSLYGNELEGITIAGGASMEGSAVGANLIANVYKNNVTSKLDKGSKISANGDVLINARTSEDINIIPIGVALSNSGSASVAANINANVIVDTILSQVLGEIDKSGNVLVNAQDTTSIITRGGTLALSNSGSAISGDVNVDVLDKDVTAEIKDTTVNSAGEVDVLAASINSFGGTKQEDGTYDVASINDAKKFTEKDGDNYKQVEENSDFANWNMFYDLGASFKASVSGVIVVKVIDNAVKAYVTNSNVTSDELNVRANDYSIANAIMGRISYGGTASIGANVFVLAGNSNVEAQVFEGSVLDIEKAMSVVANSTKKSTLITVGGGAAGSASVNGSAVANVIKDVVTSKINDNVTVEADSVDVIAQSDNDIKGLVVNASVAGTAAIGAVAYINDQETTTTAQIGDDGEESAIIEAINNINVSSKADDEFHALLVNVNAAGTAAIGGMGVLNFINSDVNAVINNSNVTSEQGKVDVIADRGFNRSEANQSNVFRNWFKDTSAYKNQNGTVNNNNENSASMKKEDIDKLTPIVGVISVAGSGNAAVAATVVSNDMEGNIKAEVKDSTLSTDKGINVKANQEFVNYDAVASVAGAGTGAGVSAVGVINLLNDNITAQLNKSEVTKGGADVEAKSTMDLNQLVISGAGAGVGAGVNAVVDYNQVDDKVHSYITDSTVAGDTKLNSEHAIEINNIMLAASIAGMGGAANVIPVLNNYSGESIASVNGGSKINEGSITITANDYVDNFSAVAGLSAAGLGGAVGGYAIRNNYTNTVSANIDNAIINTQKNININSGSLLNSSNNILSGGFAGIGGAVTANVIINDISSTVLSYINDSTITEAGSISLASNKDKEDIIDNLAGSVSVAGIGGAGNVNSIFNFYENTVKSYVDNTSIDNAADLSVQAFGKRNIKTTDIGGVGSALGGAIGVNAIVNEINSNVISYIDADDKKMDINGALTINTQSDTLAENNSGIVALVAVGGAGTANIGLHQYDDIAKAEILSNSSGTINAESADIKSNATYGIANETVSVSLGFGSVAGDVTIINLGKAGSSYSESEKQAKVNEAINDISNVYKQVSNDGKFKITGSTETETGAIARSNANLTTADDVEISAKSKLQDKNGNDLTLKNNLIQGGAQTANVGVKVVKLANNSLAEIAGGSVVSTNGDVNVKAESENKVKIENFEAKVSGSSVSGGAAIYKNTALTQAIINNGDVEAKDVNVSAISNNKSDINNESYVVSASNLAISVIDNKDENNTFALISGNSNITADSLNLHSTGNTELISILDTFTVSLGNFSYLGNNATSESITKAMIENATGEINVNNLNITADSSKMSVLAKSNLTSASLAGLTIGESGAYMNAELSAGVNSPNGLVINNTGETKILSGVKADDNTKAADITSTAKILSFSVGLISGSAAEAIAKNNVKVNTKLIANEHNADSLVMKALMNETGNANVDSESYGAITVGTTSVKSYVEAKLGIDVSGKNTIANKAEIIANNNSKADINMQIASGGAINVSISNLYSELKSDTELNIGGEFNTKELEIDSDTQRYSKMDYASKGGGAISVSATNANNIVSGSSKLNLTNYLSSKDYENKLTVKHKSTNTQDTVSNSTSGGFIDASSISVSENLNSTTEMNIKNSNMNAANDFNFDVANTNIVKDTSSMSNGGVIAITTNEVYHEYNSGAKITVDNSEISADNLNMKSVSELKNARGDDWVQYAGSSSGFIAGNLTTLTNNLNQTSEINVENNSKIYANNNTKLETQTNSSFKQKTDSDAAGFVTVPKGVNYLTANNTNKISIDSNSSVEADNSAIFNFDSNNTLYARSYSSSENFAGKPTAKSYLNLSVSNELNNNGKINAGNLVDINYMNNSYNELNQYAHTDADAAVASSTQDGQLSRSISNLLDVKNGGLISSNKDIDIDYAKGRENIKSEISYRSTSYALFGIPITKTGNKSNISRAVQNQLKLDGEIAAGQGSNKYMKINPDGTIDNQTLLGFSSGNYSISGTGTVDGEKVKEATIKIINDKISNIDSRIVVLNNSIEEETAKISEIENSISDNNDKLELIEQYKLKNIDEFNAVMDNDYKSLVREALVNNGDVDNNHNVTVDYITIINDYKSYILDKTEDIPTITEFINNHDTYKNLTETQKEIFQNNYNTVQNKLTNTQIGNYTVYEDYMLTSSVTLTDGIAEGNTITYNNEKEYLTALKTLLSTELDSYNQNKINDEALKTALSNEKTALENDLAIKQAQDANEYSEPYTIAFGDMASESSEINISGINEYTESLIGSKIYNIKGNGNFKTANSSLTVDNYSTRSLDFGAIDIGADTVRGLVIGGKNYSSYLNNSDKLIGGENGVHFISNSNGGNGDIIINNYYDNTNPFASSLENIPNNTAASNITFNGRVSTNGKINIYNESGNIKFNSALSADEKNITAVNGNVTIGNSDIDILLKENDSIFAGGDVNIIADNADIKGNIASGYSNRNLTITDDMLSNLVLDKTTGETNLIDIQGTDNNIKAIYKDGEIYVFSIGNNGGAVNISANSGNVSADVSSKDGYQTIAINNQTNKKLNIYNISNNSHTGGFSSSNGLSVSEDRLTSNSVNTAKTSITSEKDGRISLNGNIENSLNNNASDNLGTLNITSNNGIDISGSITGAGIANITNNKAGINIEGSINKSEGNITITNKTGGIKLDGNIKSDDGNITLDNKNGNIVIGDYNDNDNYIQTKNGDITIKQTNGNILNGIIDPDTKSNRQNYDLGNPNNAYKTLIASNGNLTINVTDGDIGTTSHENPGEGIDASTRDFTESINVNVLGNIYAKSLNDTKNDARLVNIRAKESDLNVKNITSDGNVILTAADWKQADKNPTPDNKEYLIGYSVNNTADNGDAAVMGQNISVIASNNIGDKGNKFIYLQDTLNAPESSVSFEAENSLYVTGKTNSENETKLYQLVTKTGDLGVDMESNAVIKEIVAGSGLNITQKAEKLTIIDLSMPISKGSDDNSFIDILQPHDNKSLGSNGDGYNIDVIPNYINIKVLDAIDNPNRSNATLKIYNAYIRGNHGENTQYYPDGSRLADVTLMADNIYVNSAKAPSSTITGFTPTDKTYSPADFGGTDTNSYEAHGINGYGDGEAISIDILGVDRDIVEELIDNPQRNNYEMQKSVSSTPNKFKNSLDRLPFYNYDFRAKNVVLSIDDYVNTNRGVSIDTLYANNAYINTKDSILGIEDGYIKNYAEFRNVDKLAVVDNNNIRKLEQADIQLYTKDTGSFNLYLDNTINMISNAPTLYNNPDMLVNGYHSAWNFVNRATKETQVVLNNMQDTINPQIQLLNNNTLANYNIASANNELEIIAAANEDYKVVAAAEKLSDDEENTNEIKVGYKTSTPTFIVFDTMGELTGLNSDVKIYSISTTGAITSNEYEWSKGDKVSLNLNIDGLEVVIPAKVKSIDGTTAKLEFINIPRSLTNKLLYKYMQANSENINLTAL